MNLTLPVPPANVLFWDVLVALGGVECRFAWRWNSRAQYWTISLYSKDDDLISAGQVAKPGKLLFPHAHAAKPPGTIEVLWVTGGYAVPGLTDFATGAAVVLAVIP